MKEKWEKSEYVDRYGYISVEHTLKEWSIFKRKKDRQWKLHNDETGEFFKCRESATLRDAKNFAKEYFSLKRNSNGSFYHQNVYLAN